MSLRGLADEAKNYFRVDRTVILLSGCLILLVGSLFYVRHRIQTPHEVLTTEELQNKAAIQQLFQLKSEVQDLKSELNQKQFAADEARQVFPTARPVAPATSAGIPFVGIKPGEGFAQIKRDADEIYIPTGSVFRARLLMPIKTSVQESFVMAETTHEFRMDSLRRIPKRSRLIGSARLNPMLKGVIVRFTKLVSPSGIEFPISLLALSESLFPELEGIYFTNQLETYSTVLAFGFLNGFADASQERESTIYGALPKNNVSNHVLNGVSSASFRVADEILNDVRRRAIEYVIVPASQQIFVVFDKKFELKDSKPIPE